MWLISSISKHAPGILISDILISATHVDSSSSNVLNEFRYDSIFCITMDVGLLWLFRRFCNHSNRVLKWGTSQNYGAYVFHLLILLGLQYAFDKVWMGNVGKFLSLGTLTCILSFGLTWSLRLIPGVKRVL